MKDIALVQLEQRFGAKFVRALRHSVRLRAEDGESVEAWPVGQAKDHFSQMLDRIRDGECQLVRRRLEDPVLMMSVTQLAAFVELAAPKRRFADAIGHDPSLPVGLPFMVSEAASGQDTVDL